MLKEMIWEVDDTLDGNVSWLELRNLYARNLNDVLQIEPNQLFHAIQFFVFDQDFSGSVSMEEITQILYIRYGHENMERAIARFFPTGSKAFPPDHQISLETYYTTVNTYSIPTPRRLPRDFS